MKAFDISKILDADRSSHEDDDMAVLVGLFATCCWKAFIRELAVECVYRWVGDTETLTGDMRRKVPEVNSYIEQLNRYCKASHNQVIRL